MTTGHFKIEKSRVDRITIGLEVDIFNRVTGSDIDEGENLWGTIVEFIDNHPVLLSGANIEFHVGHPHPTIIVILPHTSRSLKELLDYLQRAELGKPEHGSIEISDPIDNGLIKDYDCISSLEVLIATLEYITNYTDARVQDSITLNMDVIERIKIMEEMRSATELLKHKQPHHKDMDLKSSAIPPWFTDIKNPYKK